jgi:hypothetical protein
MTDSDKKIMADGKEFVCFKYIEWADGRRKSLSVYRKGEKTFIDSSPVFWESKDLDGEIEGFFEGAKVVETITYADIRRRREKEREEKENP